MSLFNALLPVLSGSVQTRPEQRAQSAALDFQGDRGETVGAAEPRDNRPRAQGVESVQVRVEETGMRPVLGVQHQPQRPISQQQNRTQAGRHETVQVRVDNR